MDLSVPFDYHHPLNDETYNPSQGGGFIQPDERGRGMAFWPPYDADPPLSVVSQLKHEVQPTSNNRIMLAARITIDHPTTSVLIGLWATDGDPFVGDGTLSIDDGIVIHGVSRPSTNFNDLYAVCISEGEATDPLFLIETTENNFYDVAIIHHLGQAAEFLFLGEDKAWSSVVQTANVPVVGLRPSVAALRGPHPGGLVVRSFEVQESDRT